MVRDWVQYALNRIAEKRDKMKVMADKIEEALFDIGVNIDNLVISIHMTASSDDLYLHIMPFHRTNLYKFEFTFTEDWYLNGERCWSEEDLLLRIKNRTKRFMKLHPKIVNW